MPTSMWESPFTNANGNKEFPESVGKVSEFVFHVDVPSDAPATPIDSPINDLKIAGEKAPTTETGSAELDTKYNKAEWDTPYKDVYSLGSTQKHN